MKSERIVVLASQSPRRRELLAGFISEFEVIADNSEEIVIPDVPPEETVRRLALQKAENVAEKCAPNALVIAADTIVYIDGRILGKPAGEEEAAEMLHMLSGREHHVCTGFAVVDKKIGKTLCDFERTVVRFRHLSEEEIARYIKSGEPMDKAGAYGIQDIGALFVEGIRGDYFNVVGFPLCALSKMLKNEFDFELF